MLHVLLYYMLCTRNSTLLYTLRYSTLLSYKMHQYIVYYYTQLNTLSLCIYIYNPITLYYTLLYSCIEPWGQPQAGPARLSGESRSTREGLQLPLKVWEAKAIGLPRAAQCASTKGLMVPIRWYLGCLKG